MPKLKLLVEHNGEETEIHVGSYIKILYDDVPYDTDHACDVPGELHLTFTEEGGVIDVVSHDGDVVETCCMDTDQLRDLAIRE